MKRVMFFLLSAVLLVFMVLSLSLQGCKTVASGETAASLETITGETTATETTATETTATETTTGEPIELIFWHQMAPGEPRLQWLEQ